MEFKYSTFQEAEFFNGIVNVLETSGKLNSNKLYNNWLLSVRQAEIISKKHRRRKHLKKDVQYTPSKTEFIKLLDGMVNHGYLLKNRDQHSKLNLKPYFYQ